MLELFIKSTHQISAVINCFFSIIIYIFMIEKNSNCLLNSNILLCFNQCRKDHICLKFHKSIICSVTRTESFMPLFMTAATTSLLRVPPDPSPRTSSSTISSIFCTTSTALTSVFDSAMKRRDLKAFLTLI